MTVASQSLAEQYRSALQDHLAGEGEASLQRAYDLGRRALDDGLGVLEMVGMQQEVLAVLLKDSHSNEESVRIARQAQSFFLESLSSFEMTHRGFRESVDVLRRLNERLNEKLEQEAKRIGHALHDEAAQLLAAVHIAVDQLTPTVPPAARKRLREIKGLLEQIEDQLRHLSHELRPKVLDELGVVPAIEFLAQGVSKRTGIPIKVQVTSVGRLPPIVETALYRIVQEALTNATRHAQPSNITIQLCRDGKTARCAICDDGIGFDLSEVLARKTYPGLGLIGIRERLDTLKGALDIKTSRGKGTELRVSISLEA